MRRELLDAAAKFARLELSRCEAGKGDAALLGARLLVEGREVLRQALEEAYGKDDAAPGPCPHCGGRTRPLRVETARVETVLGSLRVEMGGRAWSAGVATARGRGGWRAWRVRRPATRTRTSCCASYPG